MSKKKNKNPGPQKPKSKENQEMEENSPVEYHKTSGYGQKIGVNTEKLSRAQKRKYKK